MIRLFVPVVLLTWAGTTLVLGEIRWFRRASLTDRLRPHLTVPVPRQGSIGTPSFLDLAPELAPAATRLGDRLASMLGVREPLAIRLSRIHATETPTGFRVRQLSRSIATGSSVILLALAAGAAAVGAAVMGVAAALLCFLIIEQRLAHRSEQWRRRLFLELPVVSEQLGMLLSAGHSLGQALTRISARSDAAISLDLGIVVGRLQQGVEETVALREWADLAGVPALDRLLAVLALNREATDLGALITAEARGTRAEVHRELIEQLERRAQQVWIPVTVATLVPGVLFLAVPFLEAMRLFTTS